MQDFTFRTSLVVFNSYHGSEGVNTIQISDKSHSYLHKYGLLKIQ